MAPSHDSPTFALVSPYLPAPANTGGRIRIHQLALALRRHGPVDLYSRAFPVEFEADTVELSDALAPYRSVISCGRDLGATLPWITPARVVEACPRTLREALSLAHGQRPYSAVVSAHAYAFATARELPRTALVLDEHNLESDYALAMGSPRREVALLRAWERRAWARAHLVTAVSERDAAVIRTHRAGPVEVVPNGAPVSAIPFTPPSRRASHEVLFIGSMSHPPNVRAARELALELLPRLREALPDATLTLCGRAPAREVLALQGPAVRVTGTVPSVLPYLASAGVYVNPLRAGAGSSLKVPEALASGLPLVSTALGVRGFPLVAGEHHLEGERPEELLRATLLALSDPARSDARAERARALALAYDWSALGERFASAVLDAVARRATPEGLR